MPFDPSSVIAGKPGTRFRNDAPRVLWQLRVAGYGTCGYCYSLDGQIADYWPIPLHPFCRCKALPVLPGDLAPLPFVDPEKKLKRLSAAQQKAALGTSVWRLWTTGVISWDDLFAPGRDAAKSLAELVAEHRFSVKRLVAIGIPLFVARRAKDEAESKSPAEIAADQRSAKLHRLIAPAAEADDLMKVLDAAHGRSGSAVVAGLPLLALPTSDERKRHADELRRELEQPRNAR